MREQGFDVPLDRPPPPMFTPFRVGQMVVPNRVVVSPMNMYSAEPGGIPGDFHLVHLGRFGMGGAGLVFAEMTAVSEPGRITPGCPGIYSDDQVAAWKRISDFIHKQSPAKFCLQLGHSGRKGSTRRGWEGMDHPLEEGNWELVAASPLAFHEFMHVPREITRADMERIRDDYARAAINADKADFDMIEVHAGHGYLLSGFISPLSNERNDEYGGSLENRMRFPLEVFDAVRAHWPKHKPISVRISATDWAPGGTTPEDGLHDRGDVPCARRRHHRRLGRADVALGQPGLWAHVPDAVLRDDPQRSHGADHRRRQHHHRRSGEHDRRCRPRRSLRAGAAASHQPALHPHRLGRVWPRRAVLAAALSRRQGPGVPPVSAATGGARGAAQRRQAVESRSAPGAEAGRRVDLFLLEGPHARIVTDLHRLALRFDAWCHEFVPWHSRRRVAAAQTVKIGYLATLSGQAAQLGIDSVDGFKLALQKLNGKLGGVPVELVVVDDQLKPEIGIEQAKRLVEKEQTPIIVGTTFSNIVMAIVQPVTRAQVFLISPNAGPSPLAGAQCNPNFFAVAFQNDQIYEPIGAFLQKKGTKRMVALAPNYQAGKDAIAGFKHTFKGEHSR